MDTTAADVRSSTVWERTAIADEQSPYGSGSDWTDDYASEMPLWMRVLGVGAIVLVVAFGVYFVWWLVAGRPF